MNNYKMNAGRNAGYHYIISKRDSGEILLEGDVTGGNKRDCENAVHTIARKNGIKPLSDDNIKVYMKRREKNED